MFRDAAMTCDLQCGFQSLKAFTLLTIEDEVRLAEAIAATADRATRKDGPKRAIWRGPARRGVRPQGRRVRSSRIK